MWNTKQTQKREKKKEKKYQRQIYHKMSSYFSNNCLQSKIQKFSFGKIEVNQIVTSCIDSSLLKVDLASPIFAKLSPRLSLFSLSNK